MAQQNTFCPFSGRKAFLFLKKFLGKEFKLKIAAADDEKEFAVKNV
ncbi:MAG: hypothetical protein P4L49_01520 [Desulfosporosinus sp.]|nr:hypothetical protein [Desulfosporosinus sp.]